MKTLKNHSQYDAGDFAYLTAKGWTKKEILTRWNEEAAKGNAPCRWNTYGAQRKLASTLAA